jgi:hypothetical protein
MYIYECKYACVHIYEMCVCIRIHVNLYADILLSSSTHRAGKVSCIYTYTYMYIYVYIYICIFMCLYIYMYIYIYIHI